MLGHGSFLWLMKLDVPMPLDPVASGTPGSCTLAGYAVNAQCFQAEVILGGPKETVDLPGREAYSFDVMSR
jgi:hypothetical protein